MKKMELNFVETHFPAIAANYWLEQNGYASYNQFPYYYVEPEEKRQMARKPEESEPSNESIITHVINIVPNPTTGSFTINSNNLKVNQLLIYNVTGQLVLQSILNESVSTHIIQMNRLPDGLYFLNLKTNEDVVYTQKLILQR